MAPKDRVKFLRLGRDGEGAAYTYRTEATRWAHVAITDAPNAFAEVGIGADTAVITLCPAPFLTRNHAVEVQGRHGLIAHISEEGPTRMTVTATLVEPITCTLHERVKTGNDARGKPLYSERESMRFPGYIMGQEAESEAGAPQAVVSLTRTLAVPKVISLSAGDLVDIGEGRRCEVLTQDTRDACKNTYTIRVKGEA